jgi:hypothetical protein
MDAEEIVYFKAEQIFHQENIKECLNVRLYHLKFKHIDDSYERNENRLKILQTEERIGFINYRLAIMYDELFYCLKQNKLTCTQQT